MNNEVDEVLGIKESESEKEARLKPLILIVDLDDDLSEAGIEAPIIGFDRVKEAAMEFALHKPEDSDANALFSGLNLYMRLKSEGEDPEIAVVAGHRTDLLEAQRRIREQLSEIINYIGSGVVFYVVTDSEYDLMVVEAIRDLGPIGGIKRVLVEQHLGIEGGYLLMLRYLKKAVMDPRFSRYTLGIPGIILAVGAALSLLGYGAVALKLSGVILGLFMVVRGFNLETRIEEALRSLYTQPNLILLGYVTLAIFTLASSAAAYYAFSTATSLIEGLSETLKSSVPLLVVGGITYTVVGRVLYKLAEGNLEIWNEIAGIVMAVFVGIAFYKLGDTLETWETTSPESLADALLISGFTQLILIGAALAVLIELAHKAYKAGRHSS